LPPLLLAINLLIIQSIKKQKGFYNLQVFN
jgi:hypothetical protein